MRDAYTEARAKEYLNVYGPPDDPKPHYLSRMREIASLIPEGGVLDVACGAGHLYGQLKRPDYMGIDSSPWMIALAKKYFPEGRFQKLDAFEIEIFEGRGFKTVTATSFFIHLEAETHLSMLQKMWNVCEEGVVFTIPVQADSVVYTHTEGQEAPTLITTLSMHTFLALIDGLNPTPEKTDIRSFSPTSFGYQSPDRLVKITK